MDKTFYVQI